MKTNIAQSVVTELLTKAGITINGSNAWDIHIHDPQFYSRVLNGSSLALGESYMDAWWDCTALDEFFYRLMRADIESKLKKNLRLLAKLVLSRILNFQTNKRAYQVGKKHYDLGNELFSSMLDRNMNYTCGYWKNAHTLDEAQLAKMDLVCQKLMLRPGMRILDIGCGWGALAKYAAEKYDVNVVGITISTAQCEYAKQNCKNLPVDIRLLDYRDLNEKFDRICSLGMFEHVGHFNFYTYMEVVNRCLVDDGIFLLHSIGSNKTIYNSDEWISKYIFPNGMLPSIAQIGKASENFFVMEDWHNFGNYYDKTLMAWYENFKNNWHKIKDRYDDRFYRMWTYYLLSCAAGFRAREMQLWQIVFSKKGFLPEYQAPR